MKRLLAVLSAAGILTVALFAGGTSADASIPDIPVASTVSAVDEQPVPVIKTETPRLASVTGITATATEREALSERWGVERIAVSVAWDTVGAFGPALVAVLDTGIASDALFYHRVVASIDFTGEGSTEDAHGHGTHMAGTIAAIAPNASFLNVKVADKRGRCDAATVARAVRWAADHGAQVINISLEVAASPDLESAIDYAWQQGAVVIAAAGNSGNSTPAYPAAYPEAIAVAGTNQSDGLAVLSNHGDWVDIAAPGYKIYSDLPGGAYGLETGTSPAAAHVSGVAALLCGIAEDTSDNGFINDEVRYALESGASPLAVDGTGSGIVNALSAMKTLAA